MKITVYCLAIDKEMRREFLTLFLSQCKLKHQIAFFQWREMFVPESNREQLTEAIDSKINFMKKNNSKLIDKFNAIQAMEVKAAAAPPKKDSVKKEKKMDKKMSIASRADNVMESTLHNINYFEEIGWVDPYPNSLDEQKKA